MKHLIYIALAIFGSIANTCLAAPSQETPQPQIVITAQAITDLEDDFKVYIEKLELKEYPWIKMLPEPDGLINCAILKAAEVTASLMGYTLKPEEAKIFLGRVFEKNTEEKDSTPYTIPSILQTGIEDLKKSDDYITYLNHILNGMEDQNLKTKNIDRLKELMGQKKLKSMPTTESMQYKAEVSDEEFGRYAATQLIATYYVREEIYFKNKPKKSNHPHRSRKSSPMLHS